MSSVTPNITAPERGTASHITGHTGRFRWVICTVLLFGVTKKVLKSTLQQDLGSVVGMGGTAGSLGGMLIAKIVSYFCRGQAVTLFRSLWQGLPIRLVCW
jgi:hypothetical protein